MRHESIMCLVGHIKYKLFLNLNEKVLSKIRNKHLKNKSFTVISNNCWGAYIYRLFGLPYQSPTIGLYIMPEDYLKFINNLEYYINKCDLKFIKLEESHNYNYFKSQGNSENCPIGVLDDVEIMFLHYKTEEEALEKWNRRCKRIDWDNLIVKFNDQNGCTEDQINRFNEIKKYKKMICFTSKKIKGDYNIYMWEFKKDGFVVDDKYWLFQHFNMKKLIEE